MFRCNWVQHLILHNCQYLLHCAQCAKLCKALTIWCIILELLCKIVKWQFSWCLHLECEVISRLLLRCCTRVVSALTTGLGALEMISSSNWSLFFLIFDGTVKASNPQTQRISLTESWLSSWMPNMMITSKDEWPLRNIYCWCMQVMTNHKCTEDARTFPIQNFVIILQTYSQALSFSRMTSLTFQWYKRSEEPSSKSTDLFKL